MILIEFICFAANHIAIGVCVTSGAVLLIDWMDLSALTASQLREIARVLGSQCVPVELNNGDIDTVPAQCTSIQPANMERCSLIFIIFELSPLSGSAGTRCEPSTRAISQSWEAVRVPRSIQ